MIRNIRLNRAEYCGVKSGELRNGGKASSMNTIVVRANWDPEAGVWWATSEDVPGLVAEAESMDALSAKLKALIPELLELNGALPEGDVEVPLYIVSQHIDKIRFVA